MGKGYGSTTIPVQAGIVYDLNMLYKKFRARNSVRLADFTEIFREMGMNEIWKGRQSAAELIEFSEKLLQICSTYMCSFRQREATAGELIEHALEERVFGVYCSYAFYFLQPIDYVTCIRITPEDLSDVAQLFHKVLVPARHLDAACCLYKLIDVGAFRIVPFKTSYDPAFHRRYDVPDCEEIITEFSDEPFQIASDIVNDPILKQIGLLQEKYDKMKLKHIPQARLAKNIHEAFSETLEQNKLNFLDESLRANSFVMEDIDAIKATLHQIESGQNPLTGKSSKSILKHKAYKSNVRYSRARRYADPTLPEDSDVNDRNVFKKRVRTKDPENDDEMMEEDDDVDEEQSEFEEEGEAMSEISNPRRRNLRSASANGRKKATKKQSKKRGRSHDKAKVTLSVRENRKKTAQKKAKVAEEEAFYNAGMLPPQQEAEGPATVDPNTPLEMYSDPLAQPAFSSSNKNPQAAIDPEIQELMKACEMTASEEKNLKTMDELLGNEKPAPKKRGRPASSAQKPKNPPKRKKEDVTK